MSEEKSELVEELLATPDLDEALETERFKRFLDHLPIAILVSQPKGNQERIVYSNPEFERLSSHPAPHVQGKTWNILDVYVDESDTQRTLGQAVIAGDEYLGTFHIERSENGPAFVDAYAALIENDDGDATFRIVALVDITTREQAQREKFRQEILEKDVLLKELQHRVKNNLQLIVALIRFEARNSRNGASVNLDRLAGRVASLQMLYQALSIGTREPDIDLGSYVAQIASAAVAAHTLEGVRLDLKVDSCPVSVNVALPTGLIVNELMTNAFKHAFNGRDSGTIIVRYSRPSDGRHRIMVADDGIGLPDGVTWPVPGKLGALMMQTLQENTYTALTVDAAPGNGTRVTIEFIHKPGARKAN